MSPFQQAIENFRVERLNVYRASPDQIIRDVNSANETARDHVGRWVYELIQNADDAEASELIIRVTGEAIYVADNGKGVASTTIKSLSGTHLSVKPVGAIGRKGLGFKSVYAITRTPQIFSDEDGLVFCPDRASTWLREQGIITTKIPYQWLPFWLPRREAEQTDGVLTFLRELRTVVKLPLNNCSITTEVIESLRALPAYMLLTFRHLCQLNVIEEKQEKSFSVQRAARPGKQSEWSVHDTRERHLQHWRLAREPLNPPPEALVEFEDEDDKRRAAEGSVAVATLLDSDEQVSATPGPIMLHVYYPTEEVAPIPALLHADFVVKSDRTKIVPELLFNSWLLRKLASYVVDCVGKWYSELSPGANLRLLLPTGDSGATGISTELWKHIAARAKSVLKLPDSSGHCVLTLQVACRIGTSVAPELARRIFAKSEYASRLVHPLLDTDPNAKRVLDRLECTKLTADDVFEAIANGANQATLDTEWLLICWHWVAAWAATQREHDWKPDARSKRLAHLQKVPILSIDKRQVSFESAGGKIVTWRDATLQDETPNWIPVSFVDDWLRDKLLAAPVASPLRLLLTELGVDEPNRRLLLRAVGRAISEFWNTKEGDPSKFITFLVKSNFHEEFDETEAPQRCPIRATIEGKPGEFYVQACDAYFGQEWGEALIAELYGGVEGVLWAKRTSEGAEKHRAILEWIGVREYPRLIKRGGYTDFEERQRVCMRLSSYTAVGDVPTPEGLDRVDFAKQSPTKAAVLLQLLVRHWNYYSSHRTISVSYKYRTWYSTSVFALWWEELAAKLVPPLVENYAPAAPLQGCWIPEKATEKAIGLLLPTIKISDFGPERDAVQRWLVEKIGIRQQLSQIRTDEWRELLAHRIPKVVPPPGSVMDSAHQKVTEWYEACLESLSAQESDSSLSNAPLLCRKGEAWDYVVKESRWLADNNELADAFRVDAWQIAFPERLHADARKYFGLMRLSDAKVEPHWDSGTGQGHAEFQVQLDSIKPYVFVWRCYKTKQDHEQLRSFLQKLSVRVTDYLQATVVLGDSVPPKLVERQAEVVGNVLLLKRDKAGLPLLAEAVALAVRTSTDADFYENLLRCDSDAERIRKLEARNCPPEQIRKLMLEYHTSSEPHTVEKSKETTEPRQETTVASERGESTDVNKIQQSVAAKGSQDRGDAQNQPEVTSNQPTSSTDPTPPATTGQGSAPESATGQIQSGSAKAERGATRLKEVGKRESEVRSGRARERRKRRNERKPTTARAEERGQNEPEREIGFESLTQAEKTEVDRRAKEFAEIELRKPEFGYKKIYVMSAQSPGYDLRAEKDGETLRVEVKGHLKAATKVFVTKREWKEYSGQTTDNRWELWNVEFLGADAGQPVRITRYSQIPNHAIEVSGLWIELADCSFKES